MAEKTQLGDYNEDSIRSLDWREHIRLRPGMYIGKLGDGSSPDDGIYVLIKEVMDNCIDEHTMGYGKIVELTIAEKSVTVRDYGLEFLWKGFRCFVSRLIQWPSTL
jgi:topoisomerase-4 subunit B